MGKKLSESIKQEVCRRFLAGETNITKLAKDVGIGRKATYKILKTSCPDFREVIKKTRKQNAHQRRQQQIAAVYEYRKKQKAAKTEKEEMVRTLFWANRCIWDSVGPHSEFEIAKQLALEFWEVFNILLKDPEYKRLQALREQNLQYLMKQTQQQDALSMSQSRKLNTVQAVLLNLSAYKLDDKKKNLVYCYPAERPADLPKKLSLKILMEYYRYTSELSEQYNEKANETDPGRNKE